jgi:hypothetical protein
MDVKLLSFLALLAEEADCSINKAAVELLMIGQHQVLNALTPDEKCNLLSKHEQKHNELMKTWTLKR